MSASIDPSYHHFRLFSYLAVTVLSISIIIGLFLVVQHLSEQDEANKFVANQNTLLENQMFLKNITSELQKHEFAELKELEKRTEISSNNSEKLDILITQLDNLTKTINNMMF